jgi:hypothetical protein
MFFFSQNIDFPFLFVETLGASLFLPLFFNTFSLSLSLSFSMHHLFEDLGTLMINEEKTLFKNFFLEEMEWNG